MIGDAAKAPPLSHRHYKIKTFGFGYQGRVAILHPAAIQPRGGGGNDPAAIGDGKKDAEFRAHAVILCGGFIHITASSTAKTIPASIKKAGTKLAVRSATKPAKAGPTDPTVEIRLTMENS